MVLTYYAVYANILAWILQTSRGIGLMSRSYENISNMRDQIIQDLSPLSPIIFTVLETANSVVPECIDIFRTRCTDQENIPKRVYNNLYPSLMRAIVQVLLHSHNLKTQALLDTEGKIEDVLDWECKILSNNGLAGMYSEYNYRILKALDGKLPPPGKSGFKRNFFCQSHLMQRKFRLFPEQDSEVQKANVIYLWDIGREGITLALSCPKWGNVSKAESYFTEPIQHPVLSYRSEMTPEDIVKEIKLDYINPELNIIPEDEGKDDLRK